MVRTGKVDKKKRSHISQWRRFVLQIMGHFNLRTAKNLPANHGCIYSALLVCLLYYAPVCFSLFWLFYTVLHLDYRIQISIYPLYMDGFIWMDGMRANWFCLERFLYLFLVMAIIASFSLDRGTRIYSDPPWSLLFVFNLIIPSIGYLLAGNNDLAMNGLARFGLIWYGILGICPFLCLPFFSSLFLVSLCQSGIWVKFWDYIYVYVCMYIYMKEIYFSLG